MIERRVRVGFVGCGAISSLYTDIYVGLVDVATVVAVADLSKDLTERRKDVLREAYAAEAHRARVLAAEARSSEERVVHLQRAEYAARSAAAPIRTYCGHAELLADDDIQVMVLLTPPGVRGEPAIAAALAGKHIFTQGPLATSVAEADAMIAAARGAGVTLHAQCMTRYSRGMVLARRAVESGLLGKMGSARVELNWYRPQSYYRRWTGTWAGEGGGASFHQGRYIIDPFLWVVGSPVVEVFAYAGPTLRQIEHESLSQAVLRFANGATGALHASLISHRQGPAQQDRIEILGQDASLRAVLEHYPAPPGTLGPREAYHRVETSFGSSDNPTALEALEALRGEVAHLPQQPTEEYQSRLFIEGIRTGAPPFVPLEVPRHHVELVRAIYKSAEEGMPVKLPLDKGDPFYQASGRLTHGVARPGQSGQ